MEALTNTAILFLSMIGVIGIIRSLIRFLSRDNFNVRKMVLPLDDSFENPEAVIRTAVFSSEWSDREFGREIFCIYKGENKESKEICRRVCAEYPNTYYYDINNFENSFFWGE